MPSIFLVSTHNSDLQKASKQNDVLNCHSSDFIPSSKDELHRLPQIRTVLENNECKIPVLKQYSPLLSPLDSNHILH